MSAEESPFGGSRACFAELVGWLEGGEAAGLSHAERGPVDRRHGDRGEVPTVHASRAEYLDNGRREQLRVPAGVDRRRLGQNVLAVVQRHLTAGVDVSSASNNTRPG